MIIGLGGGIPASNEPAHRRELTASQETDPRRSQGIATDARFPPDRDTQAKHPVAALIESLFDSAAVQICEICVHLRTKKPEKLRFPLRALCACPGERRGFGVSAVQRPDRKSVV